MNGMKCPTNLQTFGNNANGVAFSLAMVTMLPLKKKKKRKRIIFFFFVQILPIIVYTLRLYPSSHLIRSLIIYICVWGMCVCIYFKILYYFILLTETRS